MSADAPGPTPPGLTPPGLTPPGLALPGLTGHLLIAMPSMEDPRFTRTVIYVCAHSDEGAMGLVINRPAGTPGFAELMGQLGVCEGVPSRVIRLCAGGPMDDARGFVLHTADWIGESTLQVTDEVSLTASLDILTAIVQGGGPAQAVLALGHAGWGPGQLEGELAANVWLAVQAERQLVFETAAEAQWTRALSLLGVTPGALSGFGGRA